MLLARNEGKLQSAVWESHALCIRAYLYHSRGHVMRQIKLVAGLLTILGIVNFGRKTKIESIIREVIIGPTNVYVLQFRNKSIAVKRRAGI